MKRMTVGWILGGILASVGALGAHPLIEEAAAALGRPVELRGADVPGRAGELLTAYRRARHPAPAYLELLALRPGEKAVYSMHCFWVGEVQLGALEGVTGSRTGWLGGREVVELAYDPAKLGAERLGRAARAISAKPSVPGEISPTPGDDKYYSRRAPWRFLPMFPAQATKVNAALARRQDPEVFLAPSQRRLLRSIRENPGADWPLARGASDFAAAFRAAREWAADLP